MKAVFLSSLVLLALVSCIWAGDSGAGLRGAINESTIRSVIKYMSPDIVKLVSDIRAEDQSFKAGKVRVKLSDIHAQVTNYSPDMIRVEFQTPDIINVKIIDLKARGGFRSKLKWGPFRPKPRVSFNFKSVNLDLSIQFSTRRVNGKLLPDAKIIKFVPDFNFDFHLHGSILVKIIGIAKKPIKKAFRKGIYRALESQSNRLLQNFIAKIPQYAKINNKGYAIDYTFIEGPRAENKFILFNSFGALINQNVPSTLVQHFPLEKGVPEYDVRGKQVQIYASNYVINTAINTLYKSRSMYATLTPDMLPPKTPLKLTTKWLSTSLFAGLDTFFGEKECQFRFFVSKSPIVDFKEDVVSLTLPSEVRLDVRSSTSQAGSGKYTVIPALRINGDFLFEIDFHVEEKGNISAFVHEVKLVNTSVAESVIPQIKAADIEKGFNLIGSIVKPLVNLYLENYMNITIPSIKGIKFTDMTIDHHKNYLRLQYNLAYENRTTFRTPLFSRSKQGSFDTTQLKCSDGKVIKKTKLLTDEFTNDMYYEVQCVNPDFYDKPKKGSTCSNEKENLKDQQKILKGWTKLQKSLEESLNDNYQLS